MPVSSTDILITQIPLLLELSGVLEPIERNTIQHHAEYADEKRMYQALVKIISLLKFLPVVQIMPHFALIYISSKTLSALCLMVAHHTLFS